MRYFQLFQQMLRFQICFCVSLQKFQMQVKCKTFLLCCCNIPKTLSPRHIPSLEWPLLAQFSCALFINEKHFTLHYKTVHVTDQTWKDSLVIPQKSFFQHIASVQYMSTLSKYPRGGGQM